MKKLLMLLLCAALCVAVLPARADEAFLALTSLDELQRLLDGGAVIERVYYTDGYGFSTSEFATDQPEEIAALYEALTAMTLGGKVNEDITDWYPQIVFFLPDGSHYNVCFDAHWLEIGGMNHYTVFHDEAFWCLTAGLVEKYSQTNRPYQQREE